MRIHFALVALCALVALVGLPQRAYAQATSCPNGVEEVSIATWSNNLYDVPLHYAQQEGIAERHCIKIVFRSSKQIGDFALALVQSEVDLIADPSALSAILNRTGEVAGISEGVTASLVYMIANRSLYAVVGRHTDNPEMDDLLGKTIASGTCAWDGDVTQVRTDARARTGSAMTQILIATLRRELPQARLWCGEKSADPTPGGNTIYLQPRGWSGKRIADYEAGGSDFVIVTTPQQFKLRDERNSIVYLNPLHFDPIPEDGMAVLTSRMSDVAFVGRLQRLFAALQEARAALASDREAAAKWLLSFATASERGSIRGIVTIGHAREAANLAISHIWSPTGCVVRSTIERLTTLMGHPAGTVLYYPLRLCPA